MKFSQEPVITAASIAGLVSAIMILLVTFGINITVEQQVAILAVIAAGAPIAAAIWARNKVTPLVNPTDEDGEPLTRTDNTPSLPAQRAAGIEGQLNR